MPPKVAVVTCESRRELAEDDRPLLGELWARGLEASPAVWDDPAVEWSRYAGLLLRSTWDYHLKPAAFRAWLDRVEAAGCALWNPPDVVRANADKGYLESLARAGVATAPTARVPRGAPARLDALLAERGWDEAVVKPAVSASAHLTARARRGDPAGQSALEAALAHSDALVQPFVPEIEREGEWSLVFIDGAFSHAVLKTPAAGDFRVQREWGGRAERREPNAELLADARAALDAAPGPRLYARVDGVRRGGRLLLMELELIEPALFLALAPGSAGKLAAGLAARLGA